MGNLLKWKPSEKRVRILYGGGDSLSRMDHVKTSPGKVFAVIGPFEDHMDKADLQDTLQTILLGYNIDT